MKRIIIHWTAGNAVSSSYEKHCYHYLVDSYGKIYKGKFKPEANEICRTGMYAPHTGGGNTGSIGISMCGMFGFKNKYSIGKYPITRVQFEASMQLAAKIAKKYDIEITPETILTHYEFGKSHPKTTSAGKIDIIFLPPYSWVEPQEVGKFIRTKVKWYLQREK